MNHTQEDPDDPAGIRVLLYAVRIFSGVHRCEERMTKKLCLQKLSFHSRIMASVGIICTGGREVNAKLM